MHLSEYRLLNPLVANERCVQYCAKNDQQRLVDVRLLRDMPRDSAEWESLVRRLRLAAMIQRSAVQHVIAIETERAPPFVVLAWEPGLNLATRHSQQPLPMLEALRSAQQLCDGLAECHRLGLVHGRLSTQTILVNDNGDWVVDITALLTPLEPAKSFCAPECVEPATVDRACDVFSIGAILSHVLTEPIACQALLELCLSEDPAARPTAAELSARLSSILAVMSGAHPTIAIQKTVLHTETQTPFEQTLAMPESMAPHLVTPQVPRQLGPYELVEKLGEGGMGTVYRARDVADGSTVAVKVIHASAAKSSESRKRFVKEARLLARANNPYVVNLLAFNDERGVEYLAVEYVAGGNIGDRLKKNETYKERDALTLMADVARGLTVAHQRGIVHRDIKPDNLLLTRSGVEFLQSSDKACPTPGTPLVKLGDFGLARADRQSESLAITVEGSVMGTPYYMSPEQCRGTPVDARSDIYSLGATLFHMLAGRPPFDGDTHVAVLNKHCHEAAPAIRKVRPELSDAVAQVVARCLAKNPDARYASAGELLCDLENVCNGSPTSMVLHPRLPDTGAPDVLTFEFTWELKSSPAQLWPYVSHTDRLNQAMGLPSVRFTTQIDPQRGVRRFADATVAGQRLNWEEHPYEWIEGQRMSVLREFAKGPFRWFVNIVEMQPRAGGGTKLTQTFQLRPYSFFGRWLAKFEIGRKSKKTLTRIYEQMDQYLADGGQRDPSLDAFRKHAALAAPRRSRLQQRLDALRSHHVDPAILETLGQFLEHGADQEVARIRPLALAARFRLDAAQTVSACLWAAREGLLLLLWDILCPSCRIPADVKETLAALKDHGHCEACNVDFDLDFGNSVELIFRAHPEIRDVETRTYCIGGPAFSAHVVAQTRMAPNERFEMDLALSEGAYRVRGPQLPFVVDLRVAPEGAVGRWDISLARPSPRELIPVLKTNGQVITLVNDTPREILVRLERTASVTDALTAAHASSLALFREMFPGQVLAHGQMVSVTSITLLLAQVHHSAELYRLHGDGAAFASIRSVLARIDTIVQRWGGAIVKTVGDGVIASFNDTVAAACAAMELLETGDPSPEKMPLQLAVHRGPAMVTTLNDRLDYFGNSMHIAQELLVRAGPNELLATEAVAGLPEVAAKLQERCAVDILPQEAEISGIIHRCRQR